METTIGFIWQQNSICCTGKDIKATIDFYKEQFGFQEIYKYNYPSLNYSLIYLMILPDEMKDHLQCGSIEAENYLWSLCGVALEIVHFYGPKTWGQNKVLKGDGEGQSFCFGRSKLSKDERFKFDVALLTHDVSSSDKPKPKDTEVMEEDIVVILDRQKTRIGIIKSPVPLKSKYLLVRTKLIIDNPDQSVKFYKDTLGIDLVIKNIPNHFSVLYPTHQPRAVNAFSQADSMRNIHQTMFERKRRNYSGAGNCFRHISIFVKDLDTISKFLKEKELAFEKSEGTINISDLDENRTGVISIHQSEDIIKAFWNERKQIKKDFYWKVQRLGILLVFIGVFLYICGFGLSGDWTISWVSFVVGIFLRVVGIIVYSSVPTVEFDIFWQLLLEKNTQSRYILSATVALLILVTGIYIISTFSSAKGNKIILFGQGIGSLILAFFWIFPLRYKLSYYHLEAIFIVSVSGINLYNIFGWYKYIHYTAISAVSVLSHFLSFCFSLYSLYMLRQYKNRFRIESPLPNDATPKDLAKTILQGKYDDAKSPEENLFQSRYFLNGASEFNANLYAACIAISIDLTSYAFLYHELGYSWHKSFVYILAGFADLIPLLIVALLGPAKSFYFVSNMYESGIDRLLDDGAAMADVVSKLAKVDHENHVRWLSRKQKQNQVHQEKEKVKHIEINRNFHIKTEILEDIRKEDKSSREATKVYHELVLKISFQEEIDPNWSVGYEVADGKVKLKTMNSSSYRPLEDETKETWIAKNLFLSKDLKRLSIEEAKQKCKVGTVVEDEDSIYLLETIPIGLKSRESLKKSAKDLLRNIEFDYHIFEEKKILSTSPRDLKTEDAKEIAFDLSTKAMEGNIDYFISHSWEDNDLNDLAIKKLIKMTKFFRSKGFKVCSEGMDEDEEVDLKGDANYNVSGVVTHSIEELSYSVLKEFQEYITAMFKSKSRKPLLWLDKTCIDQSNSSRGLAVLPVNINCCKKMLVLFSKTYIKRLWCVWELFTLFCFTSKESIIFNRIEFINLDGVNIVHELWNFDLSKATCFGTNEEFQLRSILSAMDPNAERMKKAFKELAELLQYEQTSLAGRLFYNYNRDKCPCSECLKGRSPSSVVPDTNKIETAKEVVHASNDLESGPSSFARSFHKVVPK